MNNKQIYTDAEIERSQAMISLVLGPDEVGRLHNQPPEPIETEPPSDPLAADDKRVAGLIQAANEWIALHPVIETEDLAKELVNTLNQLDEDWEKLDERRKAERKPHNDALKAIQDKYVPRQDKIEICRKALRPLKAGWLRLLGQRQKAEREAEERKAAEAKRRADQLTEQALGGGPNAVSKTIIAMEAQQEADRARQAAAAIPQRAQVRGSLGGRTHSLRTVWQASIVEQDLCYGHFRDHADVKALLQRLANAAARGGVRNPNLPGCWVYDTQE